MLIRKRRKSDPASSEITPESVYVNRRAFIGAAAGAAAAAALPSSLRARDHGGRVGGEVQEVQDELNSFEDITTHNNFYEFGTGKRDPSRNAGTFNPLPWTVEVTGHCRGTGTYDIWDLLKRDEVEERIYRLRCVEAWSMVIPWQGVPLANVIGRLEPTGQAKYVAFETVYRPSEMVGQRRPILPWPYVEGLRLDEALNELSLIATGLYGRELPNQNGAPLRLVVPWKYGFKSIKSIVKISFVEEMPPNTWNVVTPNEYGFYANVNPNVDHPRWSQATERRLKAGPLGLPKRIETRMFNGYEEEVAHMYEGMDLTKWY